MEILKAIPAAGRFGFTSIKTTDVMQVSPFKRWFRCRYCNVVYVGKGVEQQPVAEERDSCFAHEAVCELRPANKEAGAGERAAVERVYGSILRERLGELDTWQRELEAGPGGAAVFRQLAEIEDSRSAWRAGLAELGLPLDGEAE